MRNSVKVVIDAYGGTTTFYVFDALERFIAVYGQICTICGFSGKATFIWRQGEIESHWHFF